MSYYWIIGSVAVSIFVCIFTVRNVMKKNNLKKYQVVIFSTVLFLLLLVVGLGVGYLMNVVVLQK